MEKIVFLGHQISEKGIEPEAAKVEKIMQLKRPTDIKSLRKFLGFITFYCSLIPNLSKHSEPLLKLLRKESKGFPWGQDQEDSFNYLKTRLCTVPVLAYPNPKLEKVLIVDASFTHVGCICAQRQGGVLRPLGFASKKLNYSLKRVTIYALEMYAAYYGIKTFSKFFVDRKVTILSDCKSLTFMLSQKNLPAHLARYALYICSFKVKFEHIEGEQNPADFLSRIICRLTVEQPLRNENKCTPVFSIDQIRKLQERDAQINLIKEKLKENVELQLKYHVNKSGILTRINPRANSEAEHFIFVPSAMRSELIRAFHNNPLCGHAGVDRTVLLIKQQYYWPNVHKSCTNYIKVCDLCNFRKRGSHNKKTQIDAIPRVSGPNKLVSIDVCGPLSVTSKNNKYIVSICDHFTKGIFSYPAKSQFASELAKVLFLHMCTHGCPEVLISDNYSSFTGELYSELCRLFNVEHVFCTVYSKHSSGAVERSHRKTWDCLAILQSKTESEWDELLPIINCIHRAVPNISTNHAPFTLDTGRVFRFPWVPIIQGQRLFYNNEDYMQNLKNDLHQVYTAAAQVNEREMAKFTRAHNKKASNENFHVGDLVYVYFEQLKPRAGLKNALCWCGPYMIETAKRGKTFYCRSLMTNLVIKVHKERLKRYHGNALLSRKSENELSQIGREKSSQEITPTLERQVNKKSKSRTITSIRTQINNPSDSSSDSSDSEKEHFDPHNISSGEITQIDKISRPSVAIREALKSSDSMTISGISKSSRPTRNRPLPTIQSFNGSAAEEPSGRENNNVPAPSADATDTAADESDISSLESDGGELSDLNDSEIANLSAELDMLQLNVAPEPQNRTLRDRRTLRRPDRYTPSKYP
jgi:hypothetical protein